MTTSDWIQGGILFLALLALVFQQGRQLMQIGKAERRTANKLKVFFLCQETARTEDEIIHHFKGMTPGQRIDETEIRKTIYEMLSDQTLRFRSNGTFKARRNKALDEETDS